MTAAIVNGEPTPYRVLARKYRPGRFAELIGQEAMVRTLTNAFKGGRLAHAFILTGVRGVGKTTTARIIAKALNCTGAQGGGTALEPCGRCEHCLAIAADRDVDVIEMDAASRTGVDDIRELIEGVRYRPVAARYKVYIIDEVHMLSKSAFNALLKTLEEPPEHVKFIFATTEIRKVPVTVLSRCQRFDLRRVGQAELVDHLGKIALAEGTAVPEEAIRLIARAADGSVRDGLSLLDQAIAHGAGSPTAEEVRLMLGLADRAQSLDLFELLMKGDIAGALAQLEALYAGGADPLIVIQDLLEVCHWLTRLKIDASAEGPISSDRERARGQAMARELAIAALTRAWQMLLKGLGETQAAGNPLAAAEMALVRVAYAAELPSPAELVRSLAGEQPAESAASVKPPSAARGEGAATSAAPAAVKPVPRGGSELPAGGPRAALAQEPEPAQEAPPLSAGPESFLALVELVEEREPILGAHLRNNVHLVRFEPGRLEFRPNAQAPANLAPHLTTLLARWTGRRWAISVAREGGEPTLSEAARRAREDRLAAAASLPLVEAVLKSFPGAVVEAVRPLVSTQDGGASGEAGEEGEATEGEGEAESEGESPS